MRERLDELAREHGLPADFAAKLGVYLGELEAERSSVTTVRDPREAVERHVADSLTGLLVPALRSAVALADLGAGGGFPGVVLASALPGCRVSLVESVKRKCAFIERACDRAGIENVEVVCERAEGWDGGLGRFDVVSARALAPLDVLVEYAAPLLRDGGRLVCWKGVRDEVEGRAGLRAADLVGLGHPDVIDVGTGEAGPARHLYVYEKVRPTPAGYPRRVGMARKRPLGG